MFALPPYRCEGFHLSFSAKGYREAEYATPPITEHKDFGAIEIKLKPKPTSATATAATAKAMGVRGRVTRDGQPVASGWIALGFIGAEQMNVPNAYVLRNRTTESPLSIVDEGPIRDGNYSLQAYRPGSRFALVVFESGHAPTIHGPLTIPEDEGLSVDVACVPGGSIGGRVQDVPAAFKGQLWAVAFSRTGHRAETRVQSDSRFLFRDLPPGEYGVKIGHEGIQDRDTEVRWPGEGKGAGYQPSKAEMDAYNKATETPADPWRRATRVAVKSEQTASVVMELPDEFK
ncbi:MAG TPA: carboxypeptidase-like regulatory domain-containing protein [Gemmataceae bacterium]|nr:carboxypeptidase-like regulatory domain-containing protein [Gemmataceae bacterium]